MKMTNGICALAFASAVFSCAAGDLPDTVDGVISVEGEVTVADSAGAARLAAASEIVLAEGSTLSYTASDSLTLSAKVSGSGVLSAVDSGEVTLSGDNSGLVEPGHFAFKGTPVVVASETGLGGGASGAATFSGNVTNGMLRFVGESSVFTNYAPIVMSTTGTSSFYFGSESEERHFVQAAPFAARTDGENNFYFKHNVEFINGTFEVNSHARLRREGAGVVRLGNGVDAVLGEAFRQAIVYFSNLKIACESVVAPYGISPDTVRNIVFERANCLGASCVLRPYETWHNQSSWAFNLNGFDQVVSHLMVFPVNHETQCSFIGSEKPAMLRASGTVAGSQTIRIKMIGPISYWHDTPYETTFNQYKLAATGALTVSKGKVAFSGGSGWAGNDVTVKDGGTLSCESAVSLDSGEHILKVESGGALEVSSGVTLKVRSAVVGSVTLPAGRVLTMDEVRLLTDGEGVTLTGDGTIQTAAGSVAGIWTGWPEVGSTNAVAIPDGVEVEISDADIEKVQSLASIKAGIGSRIICRTSVSPFVLNASISGDVVFDARDCGTVVLSGDNSGIITPGGFVFSNTTVVVSNRFGLGGALTGAAHFYPASPMTENRSTLTFGGDAVTNDVKLVFHHGAYFGYEDMLTRFVQNADVEQLNGGSASFVQRAYIVGDFTIAAPHVMNVYAVHQQVDGVLRIEEGAKLKSNCNFGNGYYHIYGEIAGDLAIEQGMRRFIFYRDNALSVSSCRFYDGSEKKFFFDLNGFNQTMPRVLGNQYGTTQYQQCFDVTSAAPAALTLNAGAKMNSGAAIRCLDQASLTYSGASTQTIGFATSTTAGSLTVNSGAIAFERNAKWLSPEVTVNGGLLIVRPSAATNTFGAGRATATDLFVNGSGKIELQSPAYTSSVHSITVDGRLLERGVYSAANSTFIVGEGALRAVRGNPTGVMILVR